MFPVSSSLSKRLYFKPTATTIQSKCLRTASNGRQRNCSRASRDVLRREIGKKGAGRIDERLPQIIERHRKTPGYSIVRAGCIGNLLRQILFRSGPILDCRVIGSVFANGSTCNIARKDQLAIPAEPKFTVRGEPAPARNDKERPDASRKYGPRNSRALPVGVRTSTARATPRFSLVNRFPFTRKVTSPIPEALPLLVKTA